MPAHAHMENHRTLNHLETLGIGVSGPPPKALATGRMPYSMGPLMRSTTDTPSLQTSEDGDASLIIRCRCSIKDTERLYVLWVIFTTFIPMSIPWGAFLWDLTANPIYLSYLSCKTSKCVIKHLAPCVKPTNITSHSIRLLG